MCAQIRVNCVCVCLCEHDTHPRGLRSGTGVRRHADEHSFALRYGVYQFVKQYTEKVSDKALIMETEGGQDQTREAPLRFK